MSGTDASKSDACLSTVSFFSSRQGQESWVRYLMHVLVRKGTGDRVTAAVPDLVDGQAVAGTEGCGTFVESPGVYGAASSHCEDPVAAFDKGVECDCGIVRRGVCPSSVGVGEVGCCNQLCQKPGCVAEVHWLWHFC